MSDERSLSPEPEPPVPSGGFSYADPRAWVPIVLLLLAIGGLGFYARTLHDRADALQRRLDDAAQQAPSSPASSPSAAANAGAAAEAVERTMAIVTAPTMTQLDLLGQSAAPTARARVFISREHGLLFTSTSLPKLPSGKVYQVWVLSAGNAPFSAGLLVPNEAGAATIIYPLPPDMPLPTGVAVSLEQEEAVSPTASAIILIGDLR